MDSHVTLHILLSIFCGCLGRDPQELFPHFWFDKSEQELQKAIRLQSLNINVAKNVIVFLGDGMGVPTITAGRILKGQLKSETGEESSLSFDVFPHAAVIKTYSVDKQIADSASTATAVLTGVKTGDYMLGVTGAVTKGNCSSSLPKERSVPTVFEDAFKHGKATGVVTTTRITHATPGATYAHTPHRRWYGDADLTPEAKKNGCRDIAQQFFDQSNMFTVALAGGRKYFQPITTKDPEYPTKYNGRLDGQDLLAQWKKARQNIEAKYVWNKQQFDAVDPRTTDALLGLFEPKDMKYEAHRQQETGIREPSLAEMTEKAIKILENKDDGYFLLVEGGRIDHAHHAGNAYLALHETLAFDKAVARAVELTSEKDTLIIVTADHSHTLSIGSYSARGNPILGLASGGTSPYIGEDGKPYTTLAYANGPGFKLQHDWCSAGRPNLTSVDTAANNYRQQATVPLGSETHGGEDVIAYARGPMAHLFQGTHEQTYIAHMIRYVSCVGQNKQHCSQKNQAGDSTNNQVGSGAANSGQHETPSGASQNSEAAIVALCIESVLLLCCFLFIVYLLRRQRFFTKSPANDPESARLDNAL